MTAYQNCKVGETISVTIHSGDAGAGYGFSILSEKIDLSSRCHLRRGETPSTRGPRSRGLSKWLWRSRRRVKADRGEGPFGPRNLHRGAASWHVRRRWVASMVLAQITDRRLLRGETELECSDQRYRRKSRNGPRHAD
jgi:hypothetical protein